MSDEPDVTEARHHLAQAYTRAVHPDVREHIHAALAALDPDAPRGLVSCPICEAVGLPERMTEHECPPVGPRDLP